MADQRDGGIAWCDETWNPLRGCSRVTEGCRHCYAQRVAARFSGLGQPYEGLATRSPARWTGEVRLIEEHLTDPLRWKRPRRIFVNSMSDLFHERVPDEWIDRIFAVMALAPQHTFQVLTKRPERMLAYFTHDRSARLTAIIRAGDAVTHRGAQRNGYYDVPLPNVWLGVSVEDQATANERIPLLLRTPAAVRFVSYEPALGPVDFTDIVIRHGEGHEQHIDALSMSDDSPEDDEDFRGACLDQVIVGGESGLGARPCDINWIRATVTACRDAGVACFVKQLGARPCVEMHSCGNVRLDGIRDRKGGDMEEWPEDLLVRQFPGGVA